MEWWLGYMAIGAVVGFFAGLLGIGGGAIMVPLLVMLFDAQGLPREQLLHLAVGTGMATILFTSVASVRAHAVRGAISWGLTGKITPGILVGGLLGSGIASMIPRGLFAALFTGVVYIAATSILLGRMPSASRQLPGFIGMFIAGLVISSVSAFAAIGGAFMTIPFLMYCNVPLLQAIGTAAAGGFPFPRRGGGRPGPARAAPRIRLFSRARGHRDPEHAARAGRRGGGAQPAHQAAEADFRGRALYFCYTHADFVVIAQGSSSPSVR